MLFTAIDHVGVAVPDLDAAIAFYRDTFGMQLLAPLSEDSTIAKFLDRSGPGVQQVAYRVEDIEAVSRTLRDRGLRLLYDQPRRGTSNSRVNFVHPKDAGGVLVELVQPAG
jgi:methylmalonyl-CoA/ethylmalonyl-CoA epimerase